MSEHIYYDINFANKSNIPVKANYKENRNDALVKNPSDYYISIVRFLLPLQSVPIFVYPNDGTNPDNTQYSVTIRNLYTGAQQFQTFLNFTPQNSIVNGVINFGIFSYAHFLDMINVALFDAWAHLTNTNSLVAPRMNYDAITGQCYLRINSYFDVSGTRPESPDIEVYFNTKLYSYFSNFNAFYNGSNTTLGKDVLLVTQDVRTSQSNGTSTSFPTGSLGFNFYQEYENLYLWNGLKSIVFTTSLPIQDEYISESSTENGTSANNFRQILTDFEPNTEARDAARGYVQYNPSAEYRLVNMNSDKAIKTVDLNILWMDKQQVLYPLYIPSGEYYSVKILFRKKYFLYKEIGYEEKKYLIEDKKNNKN